MIGAPEAAAREEQHMAEQQAAVDARLAQWEADQRAREIGAREDAGLLPNGAMSLDLLDRMIADSLKR